MKLDFYKERKYLSNEFEEAVYDPLSGQDPASIEKNLRKYTADNINRPLPLVIAETFAYTLDNMRISLNPYGIFPVKVELGCKYSPDQGFSHFGKLAIERSEKYVDTKFAPDLWRRRLAAARSGLAVPHTDQLHSRPDWEDAISLGISGLLERSEKYRREFENKGELTPDMEIFYDSVKISLEGAIRHFERLADYCRANGREDVADNLHYLAHNPPSDFYQVLLFSILYLRLGELGYERYRSLGRIDRMYYPFYRRDIESGKITAEDAAEYLRYFLENISAARRAACQPFCIGGIESDGSYCCNDLTYLILDVFGELKIINPKIHVRCHPSMPDKLLSKVLDLIRKGASSLTLINDEAALKSYERIGISREEAAEYYPLGCYELTIPKTEDPRICASWINLVKPVEFLMTTKGYSDTEMLIGLPRIEFEPLTFDEFLHDYFRILDASIEFVCNNIIELNKFIYRINPSPFMSASFDCCVKQGKDFFNGGMKYRNYSIKCFAIANAVDSLLAVKKIVYDEKKLTLSEFSDVLKNNWEGNEKLRLYIRADKNKWGNGVKEADDLAREIYEFCASRIINRRNGSGGRFRLGADSVDMSIFYGRDTGATPDGRFARSELARNFRPELGLERGGITAFLKSVNSLDGSWFTDGAPCDFVLHPSAVEGEKGLEAFKTMVKVFFERGGFDIQGNVFSSETLKDAQINPNNYRDLQVRVCGWNEYFVNMKKSVQDDFIKRTSENENR